jgi:hypothetical protein
MMARGVVHVGARGCLVCMRFGHQGDASVPTPVALEGDHGV